MKRYPLAQFLLPAVTFLLLAAAVDAAPLSRNQIPAEAKWILHLDIEQFAPSQTCRLLLNNPGNDDRLNTLLTHYRNLLGVDPLKALANITLYGEETTGNRGVAIVRGTFPSKVLISRLSTYQEYATRKTAGATVHTWKDRASGATMNACLYSTGLLVITSDNTSMDSALGIFKGSRPSLESVKNPALAIPSSVTGAFLTVASCGYAGASPHPLKAMLLRNTTCATMQVAESQGIMDANIVLAAVSSDAAFQIHQILNGLIVSSAFTEESSGLAKLAELSEVKRQDRQVTLRIHCPARDAATALAATLLQP